MMLVFKGIGGLGKGYWEGIHSVIARCAGACAGGYCFTRGAGTRPGTRGGAHGVSALPVGFRLRGGFGGRRGGGDWVIG